ncbi:glycoside hydrolase family 27 protein [Gordonia polyisoprenivorans]|uniref:Alpha-galactosidase n=1 Tax=Gordonia polyisoprenivorans TaxID=84595 RepID=A0A846WR65_9ACTN|nr:glycoside hydrolase family 27 protein [Gordonia polyisoprenivorans]NKY04045.1 glycoside hydrolase family 27 protein [Gordonia polyisoprenivorans]
MSHRWPRAAVVIVTLVVLALGCTPEGDDTVRIGGDGPAIGGLPATPPMGWNSWNSFGCTITEQIVRAQADALVSSGLAAKGYRYVVVDDCWMAPDRNAGGQLVADPVRFPSGMAALADYVHARGLKFGIYAGAREKTCAQFGGTYPGSAGSGGHELTDARAFASWGVDFVKYDWCSGDSAHDDQVASFTAMRDAIRSTGRPMVYSINPNSGIAGSVPGAQFDWGGVATMTRTTNDISPVWTTRPAGADATPASGYQGIRDIIDAVAPIGARVADGSFVDMDVLVVGVGNALTPAMERTQMSMWAMMAAPLMAGNDLTAMSTRTRDILANEAIIGIDQDERVRAGAMVGDNPEIWSRALGSKGLVVSLTNRADHPRTLKVSLSSLGLTGDSSVSGVDAWTGRRYQAEGGGLSVPVGVDDTAVLSIQ